MKPTINDNLISSDDPWFKGNPQQTQREMLAKVIYESIFVDPFDRTGGIERAQYLQAADAVIAAQNDHKELQSEAVSKWHFMASGALAGMLSSSSLHPKHRSTLHEAISVVNEIMEELDAAQQAMPVPNEEEIEAASDQYSKNDGGEGGCWLGDAHVDGIRWLIDWQKQKLAINKL